MDSGHHAHPYHPLGVPIEAYAPNASPLINILLPFASIVALVIGTATILALRSKHSLQPLDCFAAPWFALCAFLHIFFEGYYIANRYEIAGMNTLFAQLWKEYTLSDSRYLTLDVFTVCVESITVFVWGPLSLLTAYCVLTNSPIRHACQLVICTAHLYGVALYYLTNWVEGVSYSRPEFLYFWIYYVGFNLPWAIVPFFFVWQSFSEIRTAFGVLQDTRSKRKRV